KNSRPTLPARHDRATRSHPPSAATGAPWCRDTLLRLSSRRAASRPPPPVVRRLVGPPCLPLRPATTAASRRPPSPTPARRATPGRGAWRAVRRSLGTPIGGGGGVAGVEPGVDELFEVTDRQVKHLFPLGHKVLHDCDDVRLGVHGPRWCFPDRREQTGLPKHLERHELLSTVRVHSALSFLSVVFVGHGVPSGLVASSRVSFAFSASTASSETPNRRRRSLLAASMPVTVRSPVLRRCTRRRRPAAAATARSRSLS